MTPDHIRQIFKGLETGDGAAFLEHVADDIDWTVMGAAQRLGARNEQRFIVRLMHRSNILLNLCPKRNIV
jgi:ketosteroid isomerase-like protein